MLAGSTKRKLEAKAAARSFSSSSSRSQDKENAKENDNGDETDGYTQIVLALRNKISQQAQELSTLNEEYVQCKDAKIAAERRVSELLARSVITSSTSGGSSSSSSKSPTVLATKRRGGESQSQAVAIKMEALERTLEGSEQRNEDLVRQHKYTQQKLEDKSKECSTHVKRISEMNAEIEMLKSNLEYSQRGGNPVSRANKTASVIARNTQHYSFEEIRKLKSALEKAQRGTDAVKQASADREQSLRERISQLEHALIAEAGKAVNVSIRDNDNQMMVEMATLRGKLSALTDTQDKHRQAVLQMEREKEALRTANSNLEVELQQLRDQLSTTRLEVDRLHIGEVGAKLRVVERERDVLVDYVQSEAAKQAALLSRAEAAESALRSSQHAEQAVMEKLRHSLQVLETERQRRESVEGRLFAMNELQAACEELRADKLALTALCDRKALETEEMSKIHDALITQQKAKEGVLHGVEEELRLRSNKLAEMEADFSLLRQRLLSSDADLQAARERLAIIEPRFATLEPEASQLRQDIATLRSEAVSLRASQSTQATELDRLRPIERILNELNADLLSIVARKAEANTFSSGPGAGTVDYLSRLPLSNAHSAWAAVPALRHVSAPLYDRVKAIMNDLYRKEMECDELKSVMAGLQQQLDSQRKELSGLKRHAEERAGRAVQTLQEAQQQSEELRARAAQTESKLQSRLARLETESKTRIESAEAECALLRSARGALDQIRTGARTFGIVTGKYKRPIGSIQLEKEEKLTDEQLAETVCAALMQHSTTLSTLKDCKAALEKERSTLAEKAAEFAESNDELAKAKAGLAAARAAEKVARSELKEADAQADKAKAANLALEGKVESLGKERQLRMAQVASLMTRENTMRTRLLQALEEVSYPLPAAASWAEELQIQRPSDTMKLNDIVALACDSLAQLWKAVSAALSTKMRESERMPSAPADAAAPVAVFKSSNSISSNSSTVKRSAAEEELASLIAAQRSHMSEKNAALPPPPAAFSPKRSAALEAMANTRPGSSSSSSSSSLIRIKTPTSKSPSSQLQLRLKRAQEAFASMRETHE